jgi:hypothetical protein
VGRCQACGRDPEEQHHGSLLVNLLTIDGTLYGDTFCAACVTDPLDGPVVYLPPLPPFVDLDEEGE